MILLVLFALNLWFWPNRSTTSFGVDRNGYKACYQLLAELGFPVRRWYLPPSRTPARRVLWLILPAFLEPYSADGPAEAKALLRWVRAGGTAVIFGGPSSEWKRLRIKRSTIAAAATGQEILSGDVVDASRRLDLSGKMLHFTPGTDHARVRLRLDGAPFALEFKLGAGRLITIADGRLLSNASLGEGDASVLAVDLARAFGTPAFDEYCHGLAAPASSVDAIASSRAMLPLGFAFLAAVLWAGEQRSWPRRMLDDESASLELSIDWFIESLGTRYQRAGDPAAAFRAYRTGLLRRLRRPSTDFAFVEEAMRAKIAHDASVPEDLRRWFADDAAPRNKDELVTAVRAMESYAAIRS